MKQIGPPRPGLDIGFPGALGEESAKVVVDCVCPFFLGGWGGGHCTKRAPKLAVCVGTQTAFRGERVN